MKEPAVVASPPLKGLTIVVTGSRRAQEQAALVKNLGGTPYVVSTVGISIPKDDSEIEPFLKELVGHGGVDYAVFMTATGVRAMMLAAERLGLKKAVIDALNSSRTTVVARSGKPRGELVRTGIKVDASPPREEATASGILSLLKAKGLERRRVAILWHGSKNEDLGAGILAAGARGVFECLTYHYSTSLEPEGAAVLGSIGFRYQAPDEQMVVELIQEIVQKSRKVDAITFTSPPAVANLFEVAAEHGLEGQLKDALEERKDLIVVAVGSSTKAELEENGVRVDVLPEVSAMGAMMNALAKYVKDQDRSVLAMLIDLVLSGKHSLIVGDGQEPEGKAIKLLDAKAEITMVGERFTPVVRRMASNGQVRLIIAKPTRSLVLKVIKKTRPMVVFISTGRPELDEALSKTARSARSVAPLVCVVDDPRLNDFNMPAIAKLGGIRVGVSTGGRSPAMAGILRRKIEKMISQEDILQVKLQGYIRKLSRRRLKDATSRKEFAYQVIRDRRIGALLKKKDYAGARRLAEKMLQLEASAKAGQTGND